jgi:phenylpyruvate tautomerase PptA (4-oxalocrotonate tautomerase family)
MPLVNVTTPNGALNARQRARLAEKLTSILLRIGSGMQEESENPAARSISHVIFHEVAPMAWAVGGKFDNSFVSEGGRILTVVTVPAGALDIPTSNLSAAEQKQRIASAVHDTFREILELPPETGVKWAPVVIVEEVPDGNLSAGGAIRRMPDVIGYVRARAVVA